MLGTISYSIGCTHVCHIMLNAYLHRTTSISIGNHCWVPFLTAFVIFMYGRSCLVHIFCTVQQLTALKIIAAWVKLMSEHNALGNWLCTTVNSVGNQCWAPILTAWDELLC